MLPFQKVLFFISLSKEEKELKKMQSRKTSENNQKTIFDQLLSVHSTRTLVKIHNNCFYRSSMQILPFKIQMVFFGHFKIRKLSTLVTVFRIVGYTFFLFGGISSDGLYYTKLTRYQLSCPDLISLGILLNKGVWYLLGVDV